MKNEMRIMGQAGDVKVVWDTDNADEVEQARKMFDELREKGFSAFSVKKDGGKHERLNEFNPEAGALIMIPPIAGG